MNSLTSSTMPTASDCRQVISFGSFRLIVAQRQLLDGAKPMRLGSRALDILIALIDRQGQLVGKRELMQVVWPDTNVVDANLKVHVAALRRALGDGQGDTRYIVNIPGRGYRFVAPVARANETEPPQRQATATHPHNLPARLARLVGRSAVVSNLVHRLATQRLVTIVGPAGIGKTAVALDVAEELIAAYEHGVWLIDLAPIADPRLVPTALASALSLEIRSDDPLPSLIAGLNDKQMLLLLDNCEHLIDAAATLALGVLKGTRGARILATSREPLRVEGEQVLRLSPLESPPESIRLNAAETLGFTAAQLFVERAAASMNVFELDDADAAIVGDLCRRLDGIPLAIELAAARVDSFGIRGLAARLDDRLRLLSHGRRTSLPRHQTISTALDWSFQLLSQVEQTVFRRLSVFAGGFALESASAVAEGADGSPLDIADTITGLVTKSLVAADVSGGEVRFRLLEIVRAYAMTKLAKAGETDVVSRRHATYYRGLLEKAQDRAAENVSTAVFVADIDNIRTALNWAFASGNDRSTAVTLAAASAPVWIETSLLTECLEWAAKALDILAAADRGTRREMVLQCAYGISLTFVQGMSNRARAALTRANELAESFKDFDYQLRALATLTTFCHRLEEFQAALALGRRAEAISGDIANPAALTTVDSMLATSLFFLGDYAQALTHARRACRRMEPIVSRALIVRAGLDDSIWAGAVVTHILWLHGLVDQAALSARELLADAEARCNPVSICFALVWCGCNILLRLGDLQTAERSIAQLKSCAEKNSLSNYYACGFGFEGQLAAKRGDIMTAERLLRACLNALRETQYEVLSTPFLSDLAEVLAAAGHLEDSLAAADEAVQRAERSDVFWWLPEALRIKGEILLLSKRAEAIVAEDLFRRSLEMANRQGALSWELRTAVSLGQLHHAQGRVRDARDLVNSVYSRFTEGFETADLQLAKQFLEGWTFDQATWAIHPRDGLPDR
jgi:predicted ATPase/DNA-binding winged helix-turn-helix (wHTH) protein